MSVLTSLGRSRRPVLVTTVGSILLTVALVALSGSLGPDTWVGHMASHVAAAIGIGALLVAVLRVWPEPRAVVPARSGRRVLSVGLAAFVAVQLVEAASARIEYPNSGALHDGSGFAGLIALFAVLVGTSLSGVAAARDRALAWWVVALSVLIGAVLLYGMLGGLGGGQ